MNIARTLIACGLAAMAGWAQAVVVNIDASHGFTFDSGGSDPAPVAGQHINPIGSRIELSLAAGDYTITNAYAEGRPGALFNAWSYNVGSASWTWAFLVADAAAVAALPTVQNYSRTLTLAAPTTLLFTLRDYYVPDNGGGISLNISPAVPEPGAVALWALGLGVLGVAARRRSPALSKSL